MGDLERYFRWSTLPWALGVVLLTHAVAASISGRRAALAASVMVACSGFLAYYSWELRMYPMQTFLLLLASLAFVRQERPGRQQAWWLLVLAGATVAAFFTHYLSLFYVAPLGIALLVQAWREREGRVLRVAAVVTVLAVVGGWVPVMVAQSGSQPLELREVPAWPQVVELWFQCSFGVTWSMPLAGWHELAVSGLVLAPWKWSVLLVLVAAAGGVCVLKVRGGGCCWGRACSRW